MMEVPIREWPAVRILRLIRRAVLILGGVAVAISVAAWIAAHQSTVTIDRDDPYVWRSGAPIYLAADQFDGVLCTPSTSDNSMYFPVDVPGVRRLITPGQQVDPLTTRPVTLTCDGEVTVSSGPVLLLYRLATWPNGPLPELVLIAVVLWVYDHRDRIGRRFRRIGGYLGWRPGRLR
jgi:hypothetical protein